MKCQQFFKGTKSDSQTHKAKIHALTCDLEALNKRTSLGLINESELLELNSKRSQLQKNQEILKKVQLNQN